MGRPRAYLPSYSSWGSYILQPSMIGNAMWLPTLPLAGLKTSIDLFLWALAQPNIATRLHLFTNQVWPNTWTVLTDFVEATAPGLSAQSVPLPATIAADGTGRWLATWTPIVFTAAGGGLPEAVQGWWLDALDPLTSVRGLLWAQRLPTPFAFLAAGNNLAVPLQLSLGQC